MGDRPRSGSPARTVAPLPRAAGLPAGALQLASSGQLPAIPGQPPWVHGLSERLPVPPALSASRRQPPPPKRPPLAPGRRRAACRLSLRAYRWDTGRWDTGGWSAVMSALLDVRDLRGAVPHLRPLRCRGWRSRFAARYVNAVNGVSVAVEAGGTRASSANPAAARARWPRHPQPGRHPGREDPVDGAPIDPRDRTAVGTAAAEDAIVLQDAYSTLDPRLEAGEAIAEVLRVPAHGACLPGRSARGGADCAGWPAAGIEGPPAAPVERRPMPARRHRARARGRPA